MLRKLFVGCVFLSVCLSGNANTIQNAYLDQLVARAKELRLAENTEWLNLVHYQSNLFSGYSSEIISKEFFYAPDGMTNPESELYATLASFFSKVKASGEKQHPQCRHIARYHWLKKKLDFDLKKLPKKSCKLFQQWYDTISPGKLVLIFPAGTDNSPSSMFGHTLFRVDKKGKPENTHLTSFSINFAAETNEPNGVVFAFKGIMGGYPGRYAVIPYYEKVIQYNDMEHRDIWEYELNLTEEEITRLMYHSWELVKTDFAYYFFLENCSYQLLALLDVARPGHDFKGQFSVWAIPSDTVAVILQDKEILSKAVFRPSARSKLKHQLRNLSSDEQDLVEALAYDEIALDDEALLSLSENRRALVLITAYDYLVYAHSRGGFQRKDTLKRTLNLLRARNKIPNTTNFDPVPTPAIRFDQGHGTTRVSIGGGNVKQDEELKGLNFAELKFRPAYHNLLDNQAGYTAGAQINFFDFNLRYYEKEEKLRLHEWMIIDIYSLSPRDRFFKPLSWKVQTGFVRRPIGENFEKKMVYSVHGGFGLNYGLSKDFHTFLMLDMTVLMHDELENKAAFAAGPSLGVMWRVTNWWSMWLSGSVQRYDSSLDLTYVDYRMEHNFVMTTNTALRLSAVETGDNENSEKELKASLNWFF